MIEEMETPRSDLCEAFQSQEAIYAFQLLRKKELPSH